MPVVNHHPHHRGEGGGSDESGSSEDDGSGADGMSGLGDATAGGEPWESWQPASWAEREGEARAAVEEVQMLPRGQPFYALRAHSC